MSTVLIIATMDTKSEEAYFIKQKILESGHKAIIMNTGMLLPFSGEADISIGAVIKAGTDLSLEELVSSTTKGECIEVVINGAEVLARKLFTENKFNAVIGIGGAQGTDIGTAVMRTLPFGLPKFMVSTVASGTATFGPYVGTKDIIMMHSVCDIQGLNIVTRSVFNNAVSSVCGMLDRMEKEASSRQATISKGSIAVSMLGTTTPGALRAKILIENAGYDFVAFHQNGTGGIAMEEMIDEGLFIGVLDINLHEIGDMFFGGLHGSIREGRLESAGKAGIPQVISPGSINYTVQGPYEQLSSEMKSRKNIIHNSQLTLVRLSPSELKEVGFITAQKINSAKGPVSVHIPLKGFSYPDSVGREHWDPEGNDAFIKAFRDSLNASIPYEEIDAHINDTSFIDRLVIKLFTLIDEIGGQKK